MCSHELQPLQWRSPKHLAKIWTISGPTKADLWKEFLVPMLPLSLVCRCPAPSARLESTDIFEESNPKLIRKLGVRTGPSEDTNLIKFLGSGPMSEKQTVRERRNFREGISSRSGHGSSRYADLWHREVWVTVQKLCTVLNSKTASPHDICLHVPRGIFFFCSLSMDPCVTFQRSLALLLVVFALGPLEKVQKSAEGSEDQVDQILAFLPLPERSKDQVDQVFGVRTDPSRRAIQSWSENLGSVVCLLCDCVSHENLTSCLKDQSWHHFEHRPDLKNLIKLVSSENGKNETIKKNAWYKRQEWR